jgi:hypothetical protein
MRLNLIAFCLGIWLLQQLASLPSARWLWLLPLLLSVLWLPAFSRPVSEYLRRLGVALLCVALGFAWAAWRADARLAERLPAHWQGVDIEFVGVIAESAAWQRPRRTLPVRRRTGPHPGCTGAAAHPADPLLAARCGKLRNADAGRGTLAADRAAADALRHQQSARLRPRSLDAGARHQRQRPCARDARRAAPRGAGPHARRLDRRDPRGRARPHFRDARRRPLCRRHRRAGGGRPAQHSARSMARVHPHRRQSSALHFRAARHHDRRARRLAGGERVAAPAALRRTPARAPGRTAGGGAGGIRLRLAGRLPGAGAAHPVHAHRAGAGVLGTAPAASVQRAGRGARRRAADRSVGGAVGRFLAVVRRHGRDPVGDFRPRRAARQAARLGHGAVGGHPGAGAGAVSAVPAGLADFAAGQCGGDSAGELAGHAAGAAGGADRARCGTWRRG